MTRVRDRTALRHLRTLLNGGAVGVHADGPLLERFAAGASAEAEVAFAMLVERHGPTVLRVCRSVLADRDAAEDAFQATFLVLVRKAGAIRVRDSLGPWLVGVAYRTAASARAASARRTVIEHDAAQRESRQPADPERQELEQAVRDEVDRLPDLYRRPILLCYFGGLTHDQAARQLACPVGTIRSRLASARQRLHARLIRRGLAPAAGIAILLSASTLRAAVPATLLRSTLRFARGDGGVFSASVTAQAVGFSRVMLMLKLKCVAATLLAAGVVAAGGVVLGQQGQDVAAKKGQTAPTEIGQAQDTVATLPAEDRGKQVELLLRDARKQQDLGNLERAFELTGRMEEALRGWRTQLQSQGKANPESRLSRLEQDKRSVSSKADIERAAVPFVDTNTHENPTTADWIAMTERRRQRYGDPESQRKRERLNEAKRDEEEQIKKRQEKISALQARFGPDDMRDLQNRNTVAIKEYERYSSQLTAVEIEIEKAEPRVSRLQDEQVRNGSGQNVLPGNPLLEAETKLAELKAQQVKLSDRLNTVKIRHKAEGAGVLALKMEQLDLARDQSYLDEINRSLAQLDSEDRDRIRQAQSDPQKIAASNMLIEERRRRKVQGAPVLDSDKRTKAILSVLNERLALSFPEGAPLQDVLKYIKSNTQNEAIELPAGIPIYVDPIGLEEAGKNLDSQIKIIVWHVPLKESLRLALDQLGLTYHVKDGLLTITSAPRPDPPKP